MPSCRDAVCEIASSVWCCCWPGSGTVPARPRWLATTTALALGAGQGSAAAPATGAEATAATPAGTRREEDTQVVLGEPTELGGAAEEEEDIEEQAGATEEATGEGGSDSSVESFHFNKSVFPSQIPSFLFPVCMPLLVP